MNELKRGDGPIFETFTAPPRRRYPVQIRPGKVNGAATSVFFKPQMKGLADAAEPSTPRRGRGDAAELFDAAE